MSRSGEKTAPTMNISSATPERSGEKGWITPHAVGFILFWAIVILGYMQLWTAYTGATAYPSSLKDNSSIKVYTDGRDEIADTYVNIEEGRGVTIAFKARNPSLQKLRVMVVFMGVDFTRKKDDSGSPQPNSDCALGLDTGSDFSCTDSRNGQIDLPWGFSPIRSASGTVVYGEITKPSFATGFTAHPAQKFYSSNGATTFFSLPRIGAGCSCVGANGTRLPFGAGGAFHVAYSRTFDAPGAPDPGLLGSDESLISVQPTVNESNHLVWTLPDESHSPYDINWSNGIIDLGVLDREIQPSGVISSTMGAQAQSRIIFVLGVVAALIPGVAAGSAKLLNIATRAVIMTKMTEKAANRRGNDETPQPGAHRLPQQRQREMRRSFSRLPPVPPRQWGSSGARKGNNSGR